MLSGVRKVTDGHEPMHRHPKRIHMLSSYFCIATLTNGARLCSQRSFVLASAVLTHDGWEILFK